MKQNQEKREKQSINDKLSYDDYFNGKNFVEKSVKFAEFKEQIADRFPDLKVQKIEKKNKRFK